MLSECKMKENGADKHDFRSCELDSKIREACHVFFAQKPAECPAE